MFDGARKASSLLTSSGREQLRDYLLEAQRQCGRSLLSMVAEIAWLRLRGLTAEEYFLYQLYRPLPGFRKLDFLSYASAEKLDARLNCRRDWPLVDDKLTCQTLLASIGLPGPDILALYDPLGRRTSLAPTLSDARGLRTFFSQTHYPVFVKPVCDGGGRGCFQAEAWDGSRLTLSTGESLSLAAVIAHAEQVGRFGGPGLIFMNPLTGHRELAPMHRSLATVRMVVLLGPQGPELLRAVWKIPAGPNLTDNFHDGSRGNLLAEIELEQGTVALALGGLGPYQTRATHHPDSQFPITGRRLPHWDQVREVVRTGAPLFPTLRLQHWDIAILDSGPVVLEVNVRGGVNGLQAPARRPLLDKRLRALLAQLGISAQSL